MSTYFERAARRTAAEYLRLERSFPREYEMPYELLGRAAARLRDRAGFQLADHLRDGTPFALETAENQARASDLLYQRYLRVLNDRVARDGAREKEAVR